MNEEKLPTFQDIFQVHRVDLCRLMEKADVPHAIIDQMLCESPVSSVEAEKVLQTFSQLTGQNYTLDTVYVPLTISTHDIQSEVALVMQQIALETEASQRGLYGLASTAQHERIIKHMENVASQVRELHQKGGDTAVHLLFDQWDSNEATNQPSV